MAERERGAKSPEVLIDELKAIIAASVQTNVELLARVSGLIATASHVMVTPGRLADPVTMLSQGVESALAFAAIFNRHTGAMLNELVTAAEQSLDRSVQSPPAPVPQTSSEPPAPLHVEGRRGDRPAGEFAVDNEYDSPVQVSFAVSALTPPMGKALPASHVTLDPVHLTIGPRSSLIVKATVDITEDFIVGQTYTGTIRIVGFQAADIAVHVTVLERKRASARKRKSR
jgi:hypothetical protein